MIKYLKLVGVAAVGATSAQSAHAAPATVMLYPSTDIYDRGRFYLDSDLVSHNARQTTFASAGLNVGLGPGRDGVFGRTDIGIEYLPAPLNGVSAGRRVIYNVKTQLYNQSKGEMTMRLVMGVRGLGSGGGLASGTTVGPKNIGYIVGSRTLMRTGRSSPHRAETPISPISRLAMTAPWVRAFASPQTTTAASPPSAPSRLRSSTLWTTKPIFRSATFVTTIPPSPRAPRYTAASTMTLAALRPTAWKASAGPRTARSHLDHRAAL